MDSKIIKQTAYELFGIGAAPQPARPAQPAPAAAPAPVKHDAPQA